MKKKSLIAVILMASLALLGLMAVQVMWINNSLRIQEENFSRSAAEAGRTVVQQLEQLDALRLLEKQDDQDGYPDINEEMDSLRLVFDAYLIKHPEVLQPEKDGLDPNDDRESQDVKQGEMTEIGPVMAPEPQENKEVNTDWMPDDSLRRAVIRDFVNRKSRLMEKALEEMLKGEQSISSEHRLSQGLLDTLLKEALEARGIFAEYAFGVFNPLKRGFTILTHPGLEEEIMQEAKIFTLYPSDQLRNPDFLMLYFPAKQSYLLTRMWSLMGFSVLLLLIILFSFIYAISTVYRQRKLAEMKNDFINNMTHEFKTPISTVSLACEALRDSDIQKSIDLYDNYIRIISEENQRLGVMAEKILQTAVLDKGELKLKKEKVDVHHIIQDVIRNLRIQVEIKDGSIATRYQAEKYVVEADKVHLANVVYNLLDNANKYTPRKPRIEVLTEDLPQGIRVSIRDNGIGISKSDQKKVFERLYRVPTGTVHDFKGFGLGLSYVKAIVEKHGGKAGVESEPGKGSTFWFFLPA